MVPDASGSQFSVLPPASKKPKIDDDYGDNEMGKYRARLRQHLPGLEQAYLNKRLGSSGWCIYWNWSLISLKFVN